MPLPLRAPSSRVTTTDTKSTILRASKPSVTPSSSKDKSSNVNQSPKTSSGTAEVDLSATSTRGSTNGSQASSRIPSPFKRNASSQSSNSSYVKPAATKPPDRGHVRQRSAAAPVLVATQRAAHSRSASAVSANTTISTPSIDASKLTTRSQYGPSAYTSRGTKSRVTPLQQQPQLIPTLMRPASTFAFTDQVQNELLQLAAVYKRSSCVMQLYQRSIDDFLATKQTEIVSKRAIVQARKQSFCAALNLLGLDHWLNLEGSQRTCQSLQNLSITVRDLQNLESIFEGSDGLLGAFQEWQQLICQQKDRGTVLPSAFLTQHIVFEHQLEPEIRRFKQQVSSAFTSLSNLPECPSDTTLASIIKGNMSLATSLEMQCRIMLQIGELLVADHYKWLQGEVQAAIAQFPRSAKHLPSSLTDPVWDT